MIVRLLGEGQYRLADDAFPELNQIDWRLTKAIAEDDVPAFKADLRALVKLVRDRGTAVETDYLVGSDLVLPGGDASFEEVRAMLLGDGLVPG